MKVLPGFIALLSMIGALILGSSANAQILPGTFDFSIEGSFINGSAKGNPYHLELTSMTDQDIMVGPLSTHLQGDLGASTLPGRSTSSQSVDNGNPSVP